MQPIDHPVSAYAISVVEGSVVAGDLVRMACERHLMDLETGADRGLYFDCAAADRVLNFAGLIQHTTGPKAGERADHLEQRDPGWVVLRGRGSEGVHGLRVNARDPQLPAQTCH